jgi:hypothetical protein
MRVVRRFRAKNGFIYKDFSPRSYARNDLRRDNGTHARTHARKGFTTDGNESESVERSGTALAPASMVVVLRDSLSRIRAWRDGLDNDSIVTRFALSSEMSGFLDRADVADYLRLLLPPTVGGKGSK